MDSLAERLLETLRDHIAERLEEAAERTDVAKMDGPTALRALADAIRRGNVAVFAP